jgi:hypothetical protein
MTWRSPWACFLTGLALQCESLSLAEILEHDLKQWPTSTFKSYFTRWAVACTSEAQALQVWFDSFELIQVHDFLRWARSNALALARRRRIRRSYPPPTP